jgi:hypothetical protein
MAGQSQFTIGARASCTDGNCGEVRRLIIHPATETITHLVIQPGLRHGPARLVPTDLIDTTAGEVRLRCTLAEFENLDPAEETVMVDGPGLGISSMSAALPMGMPESPPIIVEDVVPVGETEVFPGDPVHAVDGEIGQVQGFRVDPGDHRVTHVLLREGHLWGRKEVAIPVSAVTGIDGGIRLNLTKEQVAGLPPVA